MCVNIIVRNKPLAGICVQGNYWNYLHAHVNTEGSTPTLTDCYHSVRVRWEEISLYSNSQRKSQQKLLLRFETVQTKSSMFFVFYLDSWICSFQRDGNITILSPLLPWPTKNQKAPGIFRKSCYKYFKLNWKFRSFGIWMPIQTKPEYLLRDMGPSHSIQIQIVVPARS